jgi:hypothetical protein
MRKFSRIKVRAGCAAALVGVSVLVAACGSSAATNSSSAANAGAAAASTGTTATAAARGTAISTTHGAAGTDLTAGTGRAVYLWMGDRRDVELLGRLRAGLAPGDDEVDADRHRHGDRLASGDDSTRERNQAGDLRPRQRRRPRALRQAAGELDATGDPCARAPGGRCAGDPVAPGSGALTA